MLGGDVSRHEQHSPTRGNGGEQLHDPTLGPSALHPACVIGFISLSS